MVKFSRGKLIVFDIDEALSFEGETRSVPAVRGRPREQHLRQAAGSARASTRPRSWRRWRRAAPASLRRRPRRRDDLWGLVLEAARLDEVVEQAVRALEFSVLAKYAFGLAQAFNAFYHRYPILNEETRDARALARGGGRLLPAAAHARARPDGLRGASPDVSGTRNEHEMRPRIAVAPNDALDDYVESVTRAGGDPVRLDPKVDEAAEIAASFDGLLLTGGGDVDPKLYGESPHPTIRFAGDPGRDEFEIELAIGAPSSATCRSWRSAAACRC